MGDCRLTTRKDAQAASLSIDCLGWLCRRQVCEALRSGHSFAILRVAPALPLIWRKRFIFSDRNGLR